MVLLCFTKPTKVCFSLLKAIVLTRAALFWAAFVQQDDNYQEAERLAQDAVGLGKKDRNPRCGKSDWRGDVKQTFCLLS